MLALWVILHHLTGPTQSLGRQALRLPSPIYHFVRGGYLAVEAFFILSGFVLARGYASTSWSKLNLRRYFVARFARVYPVYLLSLAIVAPFIVAGWNPGSARFLAAYGLLLQGWLGTLPVNWNTPAWSLSCEIFFYTAFPLAVILIRQPRWRTVIVIASAACSMTPLTYVLGISDSVKPLVHFSDFLMGIAAASVFELLHSRKWLPAGAWLYLPGCAAAAALIAWPGALPWGIDLNTALRPLGAVLMIGLALGGGILARALSSGLAVHLGKSSYAMYILHVPILWWYRRSAGEVHPAMYVALVIAISSLVYGLYEEPANRWLRGRAR